MAKLNHIFIFCPIISYPFLLYCFKWLLPLLQPHCSQLCVFFYLRIYVFYRVTVCLDKLSTTSETSTSQRTNSWRYFFDYYFINSFIYSFIHFFFNNHFSTMLIWQALRNRQSSVNCSASLLLRAFMMFRYAAFLFLSNTKQDVTGIIFFHQILYLKGTV